MSAGANLSWEEPTGCSPALHTWLRQHFARDDSRGPDRQPASLSPILVVEDDFLVAMQVEATLSDAGFTLAGTAASAEEAIALAVSQRPGLVLMDIRLAGKRDGVDAALELFRDHGIRCIFATAHHDADVRKRAAPARPLGWLQKPYTMSGLIIAVRKALDELDQETD